MEVQTAGKSITAAYTENGSGLEKVNSESVSQKKTTQNAENIANRYKSSKPDSAAQTGRSASAYSPGKAAAGQKAANSGADRKVDYDNTEKQQLEALERAIADANKQISGLDREFRYDVHEVTKDIMIKIIDSSTEEVIKEIPPKKALDAIAKMWELAGLIVDEKR